MAMINNKELKKSLKTSFINKDIISNQDYRSQLLLNRYQSSPPVLTYIQEELKKSATFFFSVAFITESGLSALKSVLLDLHKKGIEGRIVTSDYLYFNHPKIFRELLKIENVTVKITNVSNFHAKGYLFKTHDHVSFIVGSSNLTLNALKMNYEWNVKLTSNENGELISQVIEQFELLWKNAEDLTEKWIENYESVYLKQQKLTAISEPSLLEEEGLTYEVTTIKPNKMQKEALKGIREIRESGEKKALVISATGTGKTYLSAFDVLKYQPKKFLFIVHREQILNKAMQDFQKILGESVSSFGKITGSKAEYDKKYTFATIQSIAKEDHLKHFDPGTFDYILIDEVHKAGAASYQKVLDYFHPKFLLGMTATPERTDDFNIFGLFDYNLAYEIRLQEAMEEEMLCPFHYFGVTDYELDGVAYDEVEKLTHLVSDERVEFLLEKIHYYGYSGETCHGLIFCSRKDEAMALSQALNKRGYRTVALTGDDDMNTREKYVKILEQGMLEYILTVDIFNEGIDIPCINQVVMMRQTQSSIIFIQQLGRGLRKSNNKDYVTIIDFIGNYKNNYLIPIALTGNTSMNKNDIKEQFININSLSGLSVINFEEIARQKIYQSIATTNITTLKILKEGYFNLKNKLGRIPKLVDFIKWHSLDPELIASRRGHYLNFLKEVVKEEVPAIDDEIEALLIFLTLELINGKRPHELLLLKKVIMMDEISEETFVRDLKRKNIHVSEAIVDSLKNIFDLSFYSKSDKKKYGNQAVIIHDGNFFKKSQVLSKALSEPFIKNHIIDIIEAGLKKSKEYNWQECLTVNKQYTRKDVCRLLGWEKDISSTIYGYRVRNNQCPIFVTYHKHEEVESTVAYQDEFLSTNMFKWFTRSQRKLDSKEIQPIIHASKYQTEMYLFVKKDDDEGSDFYYLGPVRPDEDTVEQTYMSSPKGKVPVVSMHMLLDKKVSPDIYQYLSYPTE